MSLLATAGQTVATIGSKSSLGFLGAALRAADAGTQAAAIKVGRTINGKDGRYAAFTSDEANSHGLHEGFWPADHDVFDSFIDVQARAQPFANDLENCVKLLNYDKKTRLFRSGMIGFAEPQVFLQLRIPLHKPDSYDSIVHFVTGYRIRQKEWGSKSIREKFTSKLRDVGDLFSEAGNACCAAAVGKASMVVLNCTFPAELFAIIKDEVSTLANGTGQKALPAWRIQSAMRRARAWMSKFKPKGYFVQTQVFHNYITCVTSLLTMLYVVQSSSTGSRLVREVMDEDYPVTMQCTICGPVLFTAEEAERIAADVAIAMMEEASNPLNVYADGALPTVPPTAISGVLYTRADGLKATLDQDSMDEYVYKRETEVPIPGAAQDGINILCAKPPLDHSSPETLATASTRHLGKVTKELPLLEHTGDGYETLGDDDDAKQPQRLSYVQGSLKSLEFKIDKSKPLTPDRKVGEKIKAMVSKRITEGDAAKFREWYPRAAMQADVTLGPSSIPEEEVNEIRQSRWREDVESCDALEVVEASIAYFAKKGEADNRGRLISNAGKIHQSHTMWAVKVLETFHKETLNHLNFKGLTPEGKMKSMGQFIDGLEQSQIGFGVDKTANDRCWNQTDIDDLVSYVHQLLGQIEELKPYLPDRWHTSTDTAERIKLVNGYIRFVIPVILAFLWSGVSYTSFGNRFQTDKEVGSFTFAHYGTTGLDQWLSSRYNTVMARTPFSVKEFTGTAEGLVKYEHKAWSTDNPVPHKDEGDDLGLALTVLDHGKTQPSVNGCCTFNVTTCLKYVKRSDAACKLESCDMDSVFRMLINAFVKYGATHLGVGYEVAVPVGDLSKKCGRGSIIEITSSIYAIDTKTSEVAGIPKPIKALQKCAWNSTHLLTYYMKSDGEDTGAGLNLTEGTWAVARDQAFHRLAATRFLALAELNSRSPFVGRIMLAQADTHLRSLIRMGGIMVAQFAPRTLEARGIEGALQWTNDSGLGQMRSHVAMLVEKPFTKIELMVAVEAWQMTAPTMRSRNPMQLATDLVLADEQVALSEYELSDLLDVRQFLEVCPLPFLYAEIKAAHMGSLALVMKTVKAYESPPQECIERIKKIMFGADYKTAKEGRNKDVPTTTSQMTDQKPESSSKGTGKGSEKGKNRAVPPTESVQTGPASASRSPPIAAWQDRGNRKGNPGKGRGKATK